MDENGNKVRMRKNKLGEEEWEVQEEFIDEFGNKRVQAKRIKYRKDGLGNEIMEEEYVDPQTGKRMKVEKKTTKDKDGVVIKKKIFKFIIKGSY
jgi:golgin subfamily A member 4